MRLASLSLAPLMAALVSIAPLGAEDAPKQPKDLVGTWEFAEDRSTPKAQPERRPGLGQRFVVAEDGAVLVLTFTKGGREHVHRYALDGTEERTQEEHSVSRHSARWEDGRLRIDTTLESPNASGGQGGTVTQHVVTPVAEGLLVEFKITRPIPTSLTSLYKRAAEGAEEGAAGGAAGTAAAAPTPAKTTIDALAWLAGSWTGTMGTASIEEHWSPPLGGAMLATARTVAGARMVAFEFLRIVPKSGGLVYVAQPGGGRATEFVLTSVSSTKAVFENPAHDFPQRISYELGPDGRLTAEIADSRGGRAQQFRFAQAAAGK